MCDGRHQPGGCNRDPPQGWGSYVLLSLTDSLTRYLTSGFFMNSLLPMIISDIFSKIFMKIFAAQGAPSVSQVHNTGRNLSTGVIDTGGKFVAGFSDTSGHISPWIFT